MPTINQTITAIDKKRVERAINQRIREDRTNAMLSRLVANDFPRFLEIGNKLSSALQVFTEVRADYEHLRDSNAEITLETAELLLDVITDLNAEVGPIADQLDMSDWYDGEGCSCGCDAEDDAQRAADAFEELRNAGSDLFAAAMAMNSPNYPVSVAAE